MRFHTPSWRDYVLAFALSLGGLLLTTYAIAQLIAGGIPALTDLYRSNR